MGRLLFFDVDGTLIPENTQCPPSAPVCDALSSLRSAGHKIFLCTGRTLCEIGPELTEMHFDGIIAGSGAYIHLDDTYLLHHPVPLPLLRQTVDTMIQCQVSCILEGTHELYYAGQGSRVLPWELPRIRHAGELSEAECIETFTARVSRPEEFEKLKKFLLQYYEIFASDDHLFYEIVQKGWNKAAAIRRTCEYYGTGLSNTIAFGDSRNDMAMLQIAGIGVAMGNALGDVREAANYITGTVEEDGICTALLSLNLI